MKNRLKFIGVIRNSRVLLLVALLSMMATVLVHKTSSASAEVSEVQKLIAFDCRTYLYLYLFDGFGQSVAIDGDTIVVGAPGATNSGVVGSVYVIQGSSWTEQAKLTASDGYSEDRFGKSVAIDGDTIVASGSGGVYVFQRDGSSWTEQQKLTVTDGTALFGKSVAIDGATIIVGDPGDPNPSSTAPGAAYVFGWDGSAWTERQKLTAADSSARNRFGRSVAIDGNNILIGAYFDTNVNGGSAGAAYVFHWNGTSWVEQQKLLASDGTASDFFGGSVVVEGNTLVIGATGEDTNGSRAGSAYVFGWDGSAWTERQKLLAGGFMSHFGESVAIHGDTLVIGASYQPNNNGTGAGAAYVFEWNGSSWTQQAYLTASDGAEYDHFGKSVAIHGDTIIVGTPQPYAKVGEKWYCGNGLAYLFHREGSSWTEVEKFPTEGVRNGRFGRSVALHGDTLVVRGEEPKLSGSDGIVWVFRWNGSTWTEQQKLSASDAAHTLSKAVIHGNTIVVSATGCEAAYVFHRDGSVWTETQRLTPSDPCGCFGYSVAIHGNTIVVSATGCGAAYVFHRDESVWTETQRLTPSDPDELCFGHSVAIDDDTIVASNPSNTNDKGEMAGAAYVFRWDGTTWTQQAKLTASDGGYHHYFGDGVAIQGDTIVASGSGGVYVFHWDGSTWTEQQKLTPSDGGAGGFGTSVAICSDTIIVGAYGDDTKGVNAGAAYVFAWNGSTWTEQQKLTASGGAANDYFGTSVAVDGTTVVVGADRDDNFYVADAGAVYVFVPRASVVISGDINDSGIVDLADAILALQVPAGLSPDGVHLSADVNGDGKIGLEEVIYVLQKVSGLRE